jgi:hypothetical protein
MVVFVKRLNIRMVFTVILRRLMPITIQPILKNTATDVRPWSYSEIFNVSTTSQTNARAIRNATYKLIYFDSSGTKEFYNLSTDPSEATNLLNRTLTETECTNYNYLCSEMSSLLGKTICNPSVTPSVSISASATSICSGTSTSFTATPTNGGTAPSYQWRKNGANVGTNNNTYTDNTLANNDVITCVLTSNVSNAVCSSSAATSNSVTMTVSTSVTPSVSITASASTICAGTSTNFTATPTNGGDTPSYQWKKNGVNVGSNSSTYTDNNLANYDVITCVLISNAGCASSSPVTSNGVTITVSTSVTPSVFVAASASTICAGTSVSFVAAPTNGGSSPVYQWKKNGNNVGTNSITYTDAALANNDVITCVLISNASCASSSPVTSNGVTITVSTSVTPSVSVTASASNICSGTSTNFTATPTNGGSTPSYQWKKNGVNVGTNSSTYTDAALANNDVVTCVLISNAACASSSPITSNGITMTVSASVTPSVSVTASASTICAGTSTNFTATPTNGGSTPVYQWKKNGNNVGTNSSTYTDAALANNDVI